MIAFDCKTSQSQDKINITCAKDFVIA